MKCIRVHRAQRAGRTISSIRQVAGMAIPLVVLLTTTLASGAQRVLVRNELAAHSSRGIGSSTVLARPSVAEARARPTRVRSAITSIVATAAGPFPGGSITRDACLTIAAGEDAAYECGALRLVHPLPSTTTYGETRTPTLLYNSGHAAPGAIVAVDLSVTGIQPTSVEATVRIGGQSRVRTFAWDTAWVDGQTRRVHVPIDAVDLGLTNGNAGVVLPDTVDVKGYRNGSIIAQATITGVVAIVDRRNSPFGAGWWLDGLEQFVTVAGNSNQRLWIGGDGSTRVYTYQGNNAWLVTPAVSRPDTLEYVPGGGVWRRHLPDGAYVEFDNNGQHLLTRDALGRATTFTYTTFGGRSVPAIIALPVQSGTVPTYLFNYALDSAGIGRIDHVTATAGSRLTNIYSANGRISDIEDPIGTVSFAYSPAKQLVQRINRLRDTTTYAYDEAGLLTSVSVDMRRTEGPSAPAIVNGFCAAESRGLTSCGGGLVNTPPLIANAYTLWDGSRTDILDHTIFTIGLFGTPDTVVNALGQTTRVKRNAVFALLADTVIAANGLTTAATYNARGLPDSVRVLNPMGTGDATTRYYWNPIWRRVDSLVTPTGERMMTLYATARPLVLRRQDGRGAASRDTLTYSTDGLLETVLRAEASTGSEIHYTYDATGNLSRTTSAKGFARDIVRDAQGRDTLTLIQVDTAGTSTKRTRVRQTYDAMDRVLTQVSIGDSSSYTLSTSATTVAVPPETLQVTNVYDANGALLSTQRLASPDTNQIGQLLTSWTYDAAQRRKSESPSGGGTELYTLDGAGNVTAVQTRRQLTITSSYDALNRMTQRITPGISYSASPNCNFFWGFDQSACTSRSYRFPFYGSAVSVPTDTATFGYDVGGNLTTANNHDAQIARTYFPNGLVQTDTLRIRAYGSSIASPFSQHVYGLELAYDLSGRRTRLKHPSLTASWSCGTCTQTYAYDSLMGALNTTTDVFGNPYTFAYDGRSRLIRATAPGSVVRRWAYDLDDQLVTRLDSTASVNGILHEDVLAYDARGKTLHVSASVNPGINYDDATAYATLGAVVYSSRSKNATYPTIEQMQVDGYGNILRHSHFTDVVHQELQYSAFGPGSERVTSVSDSVDFTQAYTGAPVDTIKTSFDPAGNTRLYSVHRSVVVNSAQGPTVVPVSDLGSASYYGADDKLRVYSRSGTSTSRETRPVFEEYRYDALGRRVLLRSQADSAASTSDSLALSHIERFVWDGDQLLYEVRQPGQHSRTETQLEAESLYGTSAPVYFGIVGYTHGAALDRPLSLIRNGLVIVPHAGYRGEYDSGTLASGAAASGDIDWPGSEITVYAEENQSGSKGWAGSLIRDKRDESGLKYMRNRYYVHARDASRRKTPSASPAA